MGTTSTGGLSANNSSVFAPLTFTGVSTYSTDLQQVLSRAISIAQLPVQNLQNDQADVESKIQALQTLSPAVQAVGNDLSFLGTLASSQALSASSSNTSLVTATVTGASSPASYTISNISSLASAASATSASAYSNTNSAAVSANGNLQLVFGSNTYNLTLSSSQNNLQGLVSAINALPDSPVTASILNTGSSYYLSLSANATGQTSALQLNDMQTGGGSSNLLSTSGAGLNLGSNANFEVNGIPMSESSNTVSSAIPGVTFTLQGTTSQSSPSATISLSSSASGLTSALQNFVDDYNSLLTQVNKQTGQSGGALTGDPIMFQIETAMQQAATYESTGGGGFQSLSNIGITMDNTGKMSFDPTALQSMTSSQLSSALSFIGSSTTGFAALANGFTQISDPIFGAIQAEQTSLSQTDQNLQAQVDSQNSRITTMQTNLQQQLAAADSAIAGMQSQQQVITASMEAVDLSLFGKNFGNAQVGG